MDISTLGNVGFFKDLKPEYLGVLAKNLRPLAMSAGEMLITENSPTRAPLFVIQEGRVEVSRTDMAGNRHALAVFEPPTIVGELEFLADVPSSASVKALDEIRGVLLPRERFQMLFDQQEPAAFALALSIGRVVSMRLADTNRLLTKALADAPERRRQIERAQFNAEALKSADAELEALLGK